MKKEIIRIPRKSVENCIELLSGDGKNSKAITKTILKNWIEISDNGPDIVHLTDRQIVIYENVVYKLNLYIENETEREEVLMLIYNLVDALMEGE